MRVVRGGRERRQRLGRRVRGAGGGDLVRRRSGRKARRRGEQRHVACGARRRAREAHADAHRVERRAHRRGQVVQRGIVPRKAALECRERRLQRRLLGVRVASRKALQQARKARRRQHVTAKRAQLAVQPRKQRRVRHALNAHALRRGDARSRRGHRATQRGHHGIVRGARAHVLGSALDRRARAQPRVHGAGKRVLRARLGDRVERHVGQVRLERKHREAHPHAGHGHGRVGLRHIAQERQHVAERVGRRRGPLATCECRTHRRARVARGLGQRLGHLACIDMQHRAQVRVARRLRGRERHRRCLGKLVELGDVRAPVAQRHAVDVRGVEHGWQERRVRQQRSAWCVGRDVAALAPQRAHVAQRERGRHRSAPCAQLRRHDKRGRQARMRSDARQQRVLARATARRAVVGEDPLQHGVQRRGT